MFWAMVRFINRLIPKGDLILFYSIPDFADNPFYLYKQMVKQGICEKYECVWIVNSLEGKKRVESFGGTAILRQNKVTLMKHAFRAKFIISSHGPPLWRVPSQVGIELYHGIPLKRLLKHFGDAIDNFVVPSEFVAILFSSNIQASLDKFIPLGQPRCDALFVPKENALETLAKIFNDSVEKYKYKKYKKIVMYLPTFRDYRETATREIISSLISNSAFIGFLKNENVLFIIKPHIRDESFFEKYRSDNIRILKNSELVDRYLTIYDILPAVDILVTDYSSVYFDYLLLNRPIVFYIPDLEKYRETRGFLLEPYEKWTPGDKARTPEELVVALEEAINNPRKWERERLWLRDVMFKYQDGKASERIIKYFWGDI